MKSWIVAMAALSCLLLSAPRIHAQSQPTAPAPQSKPGDQQKAPAKPSEANPFPVDTNSVPVMPSSNAPTADSPAPVANVPAPAEDNDPVRSPEDPAEPTAAGDSSSSSFSGEDRILPPPDTDARGGKHKQQEPEHVESAKEDENVGGYYLGEHNWKAALSRFESALVLDPENPDVYWGMGEAQRHLGNLAGAKASYQKVVDYDPDSKHGKDARKLLKDSELANVPTASASKP